MKKFVKFSKQLFSVANFSSQCPPERIRNVNIASFDWKKISSFDFNLELYDLSIGSA